MRSIEPCENEEDLGSFYKAALDALGQLGTHVEEPKLKGFIGATRKMVAALGPLRTIYGDAHGAGPADPLPLEPR